MNWQFAANICSSCFPFIGSFMDILRHRLGNSFDVSEHDGLVGSGNPEEDGRARQLNSDARKHFQQLQHIRSA